MYLNTFLFYESFNSYSLTYHPIPVNRDIRLNASHILTFFSVTRCKEWRINFVLTIFQAEFLMKNWRNQYNHSDWRSRID